MFRLTSGRSADRLRSRDHRITSLIAAFSLMMASSALFAHHSFAAEYDSHKPIKLTGKFTKIDWMNPHSWIYLEVAGADGKTVSWRCEAAPPNALYRAGWRSDTFKPGEEIVITGFAAKDGTPA